MLSTVQIKSKYKVGELRGFTLSMALIILTILLTVSLSMSVLLLRDLKLTSVMVKSTIAYNLADGLMNCVYNYDRNIIDSEYNANLVFPYVKLNSSSQVVDNITDGLDFDQSLIPDNKVAGIDRSTVNCYGKNLFENDLLDSANTMSIELSTINNSPAGYAGGYKFVKKIQTTDMKVNLGGACVIFETYSALNKPRIFLSRAQVPCATGESVKTIERVITQIIQ